jgi:hypothetical protein
MKAAKRNSQVDTSEFIKRHVLYIKWSSTALLFLNMVSVIQPRRVRRVGRVAHMEEFVWVDNSREKSEKTLGRPRK